ncbi:hypothetical protein EV426DRAFT_621879, partial [Tirmania nivea]
GGSLTPRQASVELVDLVTPESTPEPREGLEEAIGRTMRTMDQVVTQFLDVRGQIEQLQDAVDKVEGTLREQVEQLQAVAEKAEKGVQRETARAERVIKEGVMEMLRIVEAGEKRVKGAVEAITPITQQQIVHAVRETMREELRTTRVEWLEMMRAATQRSVPQPRQPPPFRVLPENISMHAPAPVMLPAASPRVVRIVEDLRASFGVQQPPTVIEKPTSMGDGKAAEALGEEDSQRPEVKALFKGLDAIGTQEGSLGPTQVLESQLPGSFPAEPVQSVGAIVPVVPVVATSVVVESAESVGAVGSVVPVVVTPAATSAARARAVRRMSFSSDGSDASRDDPSFIRRVRQ